MYGSPEGTSGKFCSIISGSDIASRTPTRLSRTPRYYVGPRDNISDLEIYIGVRDIISGSKIILSDPEIIVMFLCVYLGVRGTMSDPEIIEKIFSMSLRGFRRIGFFLAAGQKSWLYAIDSDRCVGHSLANLVLPLRRISTEWFRKLRSADGRRRRTVRLLSLSSRGALLMLVNGRDDARPQCCARRRYVRDANRNGNYCSRASLLTTKSLQLPAVSVHNAVAVIHGRIRCATVCRRAKHCFMSVSYACGNVSE